jgi:2-polyprenyl-3-methyl-5-hydroxy-6-metoxy-1,4-benzoquinol methylase
MNWNHNTHYHGIVTSAIPSDCRRALDVGCGRGALAQKLARHCDEVVAIDVDHECLARAKATPGVAHNIAFLRGDVLTQLLPENNFDFVVAVATLHHLPLRSALLRFRNLLRSGGVLVVIGLYRTEAPIDYAFAAVALPISRAIRLVRGEEEVGAPLQEPAETLQDIRRECDSLLPGATVRRRLFFRYSFVWRKP